MVNVEEEKQGEAYFEDNNPTSTNISESFSPEKSDDDEMNDDICLRWVELIRENSGIVLVFICPRNFFSLSRLKFPSWFRKINHVSVGRPTLPAGR